MQIDYNPDKATQLKYFRNAVNSKYSMDLTIYRLINY